MGRPDQLGQQPDQSQLGSEDGVDLVDADSRVMQERPHDVDGFLIQLDRRDDEVSRCEGSDEADVRIGIGIDDASIELSVDRLHYYTRFAI